MEWKFHDFKPALASSSLLVSMAIWNNPVFRLWYLGEPINKRVISLEESIKIFRWALDSKVPFILDNIWRDNSQLRSWYAGEKVVGCNSTGELAEYCISNFELFKDFQSALRSQSINTIIAMWENNKTLLLWHHGEQVQLGYSELGHPIIGNIGVETLITNFSLALLIPLFSIINAIWVTNLRFHQSLKTLDAAESIKLLQLVLASSRSGKSVFTTQYVANLEDSTVLAAVLGEIQKSCVNRKITSINKNKMEVLQNRLQALEESNAKKHKEPPAVLNPASKKQKTESVEQDLQSLSPAMLVSNPQAPEEHQVVDDALIPDSFLETIFNAPAAVSPTFFRSSKPSQEEHELSAGGSFSFLD